MDERKRRALLSIIFRLVARHHQGLIVLDEPSFELFEIAKRINFAADDTALEAVFDDLEKFNK